MQWFKHGILAITLLYLSQSIAHIAKEGSITAALGPFLFKNDFSRTSSGANSPVLPGAGLIVVGDVNSKGSLEIGIFHMNNKRYLRSENSQYILEETQLIHISMGYRWWSNPYFSYSLSIFSAYSMGRPHMIHSDFAQGSEIITSANDIVKYGLDLAIQNELWAKGKYGVISDVRYSVSLTNKTNEKSNYASLFIGLRALIQEKYPSSGKERKKP